MKKIITKNLKESIEIDQHKLNQTDLLNARKKQLADKKESTNNAFPWLTKYSRDFLAAGYLTKDTSPEKRIREIANRAEDILGIPGYSNKFFHYMSEGFFSLSSPVWSNFGKKTWSSDKLFWVKCGR